jgi:hypothetical protein
VGQGLSDRCIQPAHLQEISPPQFLSLSFFSLDKRSKTIGAIIIKKLNDFSPISNEIVYENDNSTDCMPPRKKVKNKYAEF